MLIVNHVFWDRMSLILSLNLRMMMFSNLLHA